VSVYLDASVLVGLFTADSFSPRARVFLADEKPVVIVSDFASAEFASAVGRLVRTREITIARARRMFAEIDGWIARAAKRIETVSADIVTAQSFLRRLDLPLRTPDAVNIAIAQRIDASLATFDDKMRAAAAAIGISIATI
jgi:predicted nucleic acid-binding protein